MRGALTLTLILLVAQRFHLVFSRVYDPDELEHLHAGYLVGRGQVPYRDFFEHHGPLTYWFSAPLIGWCQDPVTALTLLRFVALALSVATLIGIGLLARSLAPRVSPLLPMLATWTLPSFVEKSTEWRPDAIATCALAFAAWLLVRPQPSRWRNPFLAGLLLAFALLSTQKAIFLTVGLVVGSLLHHLMRREKIFPALFAGTLGFFLPVVITLLILYGQNALHDAYRNLVELPLFWPARGGGNYLWARPAWSPLHWGILLVATLGMMTRPATLGNALIPFTALIAHGLGMLVTPATYFQFYMLAVPLGVTLALCWLHEAQPIWPKLALVVGGALALARFALTFLGEGGNARDPYSMLDAITAGAVFLALALAALLFLFRRNLLRAAMIGFVVAVALASFGRVLIPSLYWPNRLQVAELRRIHQLTESIANTNVLDGFTGMAPLRPSTSYWWWINEHTIPILRSLGEDARLRALIARGIPTLVLYDENLAKLGGLEPFLLGHYVRTPSIAPMPYQVFLRSDATGPKP